MKSEISKRDNKILVKLNKTYLSLSDGIIEGGPILLAILGVCSFYRNGDMWEMRDSLKDGE